MYDICKSYFISDMSSAVIYGDCRYSYIIYYVYKSRRVEKLDKK